MTKKPSRVRVLMMPYQDDDDTDPVGYSGPATVLTGLPRTIRRHELRLIVPLADSTIYEMEKRGDFPRRFNLTPRCVVWDLEEVETWLEQRGLVTVLCRSPVLLSHLGFEGERANAAQI